jgi:hypothetical protein
MAIIRKGDKEAENALRERARGKIDYGRDIEPSEQAVRTKKRKAAEMVKIDPKTGTATDKSPRYRDKDYRGGGMSGAAIAHVKRGKTTVKNNPSLFSGIIQSGELVKGGNGPLADKLRYARRRRERFAEGHDGAKG